MIVRVNCRTDTALTIKAEPRAGVSDDNDDDAEEIDVGNDLKGAPTKSPHDEDSDKEGDDDGDMEEDDLEDLDFELDSFEDPDSPDSWNDEDDLASGRGSSTGSNVSLDATLGRLACIPVCFHIPHESSSLKDVPASAQLT